MSTLLKLAKGLAIFVATYVAIAGLLLTTVPMFFSWHSVDLALVNERVALSETLPHSYWAFPGRKVESNVSLIIIYGHLCGAQLLCASSGYKFAADALRHSAEAPTSNGHIKKLLVRGNTVEAEVVTPMAEVRAEYVVSADQTKVNLLKFSFKRGAMSYMPLLALLSPLLALLVMSAGYFWLLRRKKRLDDPRAT
jgi:hypothetical protein